MKESISDSKLIVYRITKQKRIRDISGKGSSVTGGRWNNKGTPALYTASNVSLALLENLVHIPKIMDLKYALAYFEINNSNVIRRVEDLDLSKLSSTENSDIGTFAFDKLNVPVLSVPSAIVPIERNYILNPIFAGSAFNLKSTELFTIDKRLLINRF